MKPDNPIRLKVCGMRDARNMIEVAALHPDYMGFIFYRNSKRAVPLNFRIPNGFPSGIKRVGVFVDESTSAILNLVREFSLDFVQLHGEESPRQCEELRAAGPGVIKVFAIGAAFDFKTVEPFKSVVNYFLFDTKGAEYGGTGKVFDWRILQQYDQKVPFFLSGGLSPGNIHDVARLRGMNLHALDVNSGVEVRPGLKDVEKIKKLQSLTSPPAPLRGGEGRS
jgi:phosphoribosylanthranilate isomerase